MSEKEFIATILIILVVAMAWRFGWVHKLVYSYLTIASLTGIGCLLAAFLL